MRNFIACAFAVLLFSSASLVASNAQSTRSKSKIPSTILPQAAPVYNLLKAIETNDFNLYRSVWSSEALKKRPTWFDEQNWKRTRENELDLLRESGIYSLKGLKYTFKGGDSTGAVYFTSKRGRRVRHDVIKENGAWKLKALPEATLDVPSAK